MADLSSVPAPGGLAVSRRGFLGWGIAAIAGFVAAAVGVPALGYVVSPALAARASQWLRLGLVADFQPGAPATVDISLVRKDGWIERTDRLSVWVLAKSAGEFTVFNGRCTHLGCAYSWKADSKEFFCPCHDGRFDAAGRVVGGPPPRPLDELPTKIEDGVLLVQYKDYKLGVAEKVEL